MTVIDHTSLARWRSDPAGFIERNLINPETNKPFKLLDAERSFLQHAFELDDDGRLKHSEQVYSGPKKSGKTALGAIHLLTTTLLFGGKYAEGYALANDLEQATSRVFEATRRIVEASPLLRAAAKVYSDKIIMPSTGAVICAIASDYTSAAGGAPTISCFDELWGYTSERSRRLWEEMSVTPTRKISLRLTVTYAGFDGESNLLHELYKRGMAQPEVAPNLRAGDGLLMFWSHEPIAPWQDAKWLAEMRRSLRPNQFLRMIENRFVTTESAFVTTEMWDACVQPMLKPVIADRSLETWIGVDASVRRDSTALVAVCWDKARQGVRLVNHRIFQPSADAPIDFEAMVEETLLEWAARYKVKAIWFDPFQMIAVAQRLASQYRLPMEEYPQTVTNLTATSQGLFELVKGRNLAVYADEEIRLAVSRAVAIETPRGWRIGKDKQSYKIDVVVALSMAALAAVRAHAAPEQRLRMVIGMQGTVPLDGSSPAGYEVDPVTLKPINFDAFRNPLAGSEGACVPGKGLPADVSLFNSQMGILNHPVRR